MARHRSKYLWTAMKEGSRKPAEATRRMNAWDSGGGWRPARAADDWRQCSRPTGGAGGWRVRGPIFVGGRGRGLSGYTYGVHLMKFCSTAGAEIFIFRAILPRWWIPGMTGWVGLSGFGANFGHWMPRMPRRFSGVAGFGPPGPLRMKGGTPRRTGTMLGCGFKDWERASVRAPSCGEGRPKGCPTYPSMVALT